MNISTTYRTTPWLVLRGNIAASRVPFAVQWLPAAVFVAWAILARDLLPLVPALAYVAYVVFAVWRALKPHTVPGHAATITIDDEAFRDQCSAATGIGRWSSFEGAKRVGHFWVLRFSGRAPMFLPVSALDDSQAAAFEQLLEAKARDRASGALVPDDEPVDARVVTTFRSTPKELLRGARAAQRSATLVVWAVSGCAVIVGVLLRSPWVVLWGVAYVCVHELVTRLHARRHHAGLTTFTITMTDDEYRVRSRNHETGRSWDTFKSVKRTGDHWVLKAKGPGAMSLPASALDDRQTAAFEDLMRAKGLLAQSNLPAV